jgi:hypothetical protein
VKSVKVEVEVEIGAGAGAGAGGEERISLPEYQALHLYKKDYRVKAMMRESCFLHLSNYWCGSPYVPGLRSHS